MLATVFVDLEQAAFIEACRVFNDWSALSLKPVSFLRSYVDFGVTYFLLKILSLTF